MSQGDRTVRRASVAVVAALAIAAVAFGALHAHELRMRLAGCRSATGKVHSIERSDGNPKYWDTWWGPYVPRLGHRKYSSNFRSFVKTWFDVPSPMGDGGTWEMLLYKREWDPDWATGPYRKSFHEDYGQTEETVWVCKGYIEWPNGDQERPTQLCTFDPSNPPGDDCKDAP